MNEQKNHPRIIDLTRRTWLTGAGVASLGAAAAGCALGTGGLEAPPGPSRTGLQSPTDFINVQDFGPPAANNDWTAAIQAAITAAGDGSVIYFPPGEYGVVGYDFGGAFNQAIALRSNITLLGAGAASCVRAIADKPVTLFRGYPDESLLENVRVTNLRFLGNANEVCDPPDWHWLGGGAAFGLYWFRDVTFDHCIFENLPLGAVTGAYKGNNLFGGQYVEGGSSGLYFHHNRVFANPPHVTTTGLQLHRLSQARVTHNLFERCSRAFTIELDPMFPPEVVNDPDNLLGTPFEYRVRDITFAHNVCRNGLVDRRRSSRMTVTSFHLSVDVPGPNTAGMFGPQIENVTVAHNRFESNDNRNTLPDCAGTPVQTQGNEVYVRGYLIQDRCAVGVSIIGNVFTGYKPRVTTGPNPVSHDDGHIFLWAVDGGAVTGNTIVGEAGQKMNQAIWLKDTRHLNVTGNRIVAGDYTRAIYESAAGAGANLYFANASNRPNFTPDLGTSGSIALQAASPARLDLNASSYAGYWTAAGGMVMP